MTDFAHSCKTTRVTRRRETELQLYTHTCGLLNVCNCCNHRLSKVAETDVYRKGQELRENLQERWETSDSPLVHKAEDIKERFFTQVRSLGRCDCLPLNHLWALAFDCCPLPVGSSLSGTAVVCMFDRGVVAGLLAWYKLAS